MFYLPDYTARNIGDIDYSYLKSRGIEVCFFDLDHTMVQSGSVKIDSSVISMLRDVDIKIYIATNRSYSPALDKMAKQINASGVMYSKNRSMFKPRKVYYNELIKTADLPAEKIIMIGDRIIQDIIGANLADVNSLLVEKFGKLGIIETVATLIDRLIPFIFRTRYTEINKKSKRDN
jgi:hypothetical protein